MVSDLYSKYSTKYSDSYLQDLDSIQLSMSDSCGPLSQCLIMCLSVGSEQAPGSTKLLHESECAVSDSRNALA